MAERMLATPQPDTYHHLMDVARPQHNARSVSYRYSLVSSRYSDIYNSMLPRTLNFLVPRHLEAYRTLVNLTSLR